MKANSDLPLVLLKRLPAVTTIWRRHSALTRLPFSRDADNKRLFCNLYPAPHTLNEKLY